MNTDQPLVSIGVPVYNGEKYLGQTLESLVTQSYPNLEIIISDNGSTDGTAEICRQFAARDARIRYVQSAVNRGAAWNYNRTFALAQGKYFKWAAADDLCAPTWVERCVAVLEARPEVVVAFTRVVDIDDQGNELCVKQSTVQSTAALSYTRFCGVSTVRPSAKCEEVFGLMRRHVLARTKLIDNYSDSDRTLLADLVLHGPFYEVPEPLFYHRIHVENSVTNKDRYVRAVWFDTSAAGKVVLPNWRQLWELFWVVARGPVPMTERLRCYLHLLTWVKRRRRPLLEDLMRASGQLAGQLTRRTLPAVSSTRH